MKTQIEFILLMLFRGLMFPISILLFPLAFPFRRDAYRYTNKHGNVGWHPLQWCNWFFTKDGERGDWYTGPYWYMQETKDKYFTEYINESKEDPIPLTFKQKLIYFFIAYRWCGFRNFMWNLYRIIFEEGGTWNGLHIDDIDLVLNDIHPHTSDKLIMPQLKYTDDECNYRDNKGPILLTYGMCNFPLNRCSIFGKKQIEFPTVKHGKRRFLYRRAFVRRVWKWDWHYEFYWGWMYQSGTPMIYFKNKFKKTKK